MTTTRAPATPPTRALPYVLRRLFAGGPPLKLLVGELGAAIAPPDGNAYVNVLIGGDTIVVPRLAGAVATTGKPAYMLASGDFILFIGTVST